jgi:HEAT repeat protein
LVKRIRIPGIIATGTALYDRRPKRNPKGEACMSHWKALEPLIVEDALRALRELLADNPDDQFYVAAFHGVYRERDGTISLPSLGANTVAAREDEEEASGDFWDADWNPADWDHELVDFESDALNQAAGAADKAARQASRAGWLQAEKDCFDMLVSASQKVREALGDSPHASQLTPDFVVFVHDEAYATDLARRCIGDKAFFRLFPDERKKDRERQRVAALPEAERIDFLVGRLHRNDGAIGSEEATEQLCAIGAPAVPALLARMDHGKSRSKHGWDGAMLLGRIGAATPEVLDALKTQMATSREEPGRAWAARALAYLGQSDWLLAQLEQAEGNETDAARMAIEGLCAPYSSFRDPTPLPLDYRTLEALLEGPPATVGLVLDILRPGSGYCELRAGEVDEALRGLASPHAFVRRHAASLCWERGLGDAIGQRLLPVLAERLAKDDNADVRWQAARSIGYWKAAGQPWHAAVEHAALHDTDERVRAAAQSVLKGDD